MALQTGDSHDAQKVERATCSYENLSASFKSDKKRDFKAQYAHIYFTRLTEMRNSLKEAAKLKWGKHCSWSISRRGHVRRIFQGMG